MSFPPRIKYGVNSSGNPGMFNSIPFPPPPFSPSPAGGGMARLREEGENGVLGDADRFIGDLIEEVRYAELLGAGRKTLADLLLEYLGHPDHAQNTALGGDELPLGGVVLAVADEARRAQGAPDGAGPG